MTRWMFGLALLLASPTWAKDQGLVLRPFLGFSSLEFERSGRDLEVYQANSPVKLGLAVSYADWGGALALAVDSMEDEATYGHTDSLDLSLHWMGDRWGWDLFAQRYIGLYQDLNGEPLRRFSEAAVRRLGTTVYYALNPNFSPGVAFNQSGRPQASMGSWMLLGGLDYGDFSSKDERLDQLYGLSLGGGWGQIWSWQGWFVAPLIMLGVGPAELERGNSAGLQLLLKGQLRLSMGYHGSRYFLGLNSGNDWFATFSEEDSVQWMSLMSEIAVGLLF